MLEIEPSLELHNIEFSCRVTFHIQNVFLLLANPCLEWAGKQMYEVSYGELISTYRSKLDDQTYFPILIS